MTQDQMMMLLRIALQITGTVLITHGFENATEWAQISGAVLTLGPIGWSMWARRQAGLKATVGNLPGTVVVTAAPSSDTASLAGKIAALPEAHTVVTTPEIAAAAPSSKVITGS